MPDGNRRVDLPLQTRLAPIDAVDVAARTANVVWSTGARVKRREWLDWDAYQDYWEELSLDPAHVRMGRLTSGSAPVLNAHNRWSLEDQIGVVENATLGRGEGRALLRFSQREDVKPIFQDIADKIVRNVSVGYAVYKVEKLPPDERSEGLPIRRAIDWEPHEISPVPIGADAGAGVRSEQQRMFSCEIIDPNPADSAITRKEVHMDEATRAAEEAANIKLEQERAAETQRVRKEAADTAAMAERKRVKDIRDLVRSQKLSDTFADALVDDGKSLDEARAAVLDELAKKTDAVEIRSGHQGIDTVSDETVNRREATVEALLHRADPGRHKLTERAKPWAGFTLRELMRKCLEVRGIRTDGMSISQMWERTFQSGSDLPAIVLDAANKSLRQAYESTPRSFVPWTRRASAPDFKNINRIQLSGAPSLLEIKSGGEYKRGAVTDGKEVYQLATYGRIMGINRQTIINDDMDAFTRLPALAARAAADLESDTVYGVLTANAALGVDSVALFHASHANTGTGVISVDNIGAGRALMRKQTGLEGRVINARPSFLIVPASRESLAEQYTSADFVSAKSSDINPFRQGKPSALTAIAEPRLDASSTAIWYLSADPAQIDTIEYAYLEGQEGVYLETRMGWDVDGMELKVRLDFAAKAIDFRGLYRSTGS
jgi:hypothetical protein